MKQSYLKRRSSEWSRHADAWRALSCLDFTSSWDKLVAIPELMVGARSFVPGLECAYVGQTDVATAFFKRAVATADRIVAEGLCQRLPATSAGYPRNLAVVLRGRAYAHWLLGKPLDRQELRRVADHFREWCSTKAMDRERSDDPLKMDFLIAAVRAAMIACDLDFAGAILRTQHKLRWHFEEERSLLGRLIEMYPDVTDAFDIEFEAFFDKARNPDYHDGPPQQVDEWVPHDREMLALETGIIREMYIIRASPHDSVDPKAVIDAVAY